MTAPKIETVSVKYSFTTPATLLGRMEVPKAMFDALPDDMAWSDEIEQYIVNNHDYLKQPPEIEPEFDVDFDSIDQLSKTESAA